MKMEFKDDDLHLRAESHEELKCLQQYDGAEVYVERPNVGYAESFTLKIEGSVSMASNTQPTPAPQVADVVIYRPRIDDPKFHDKGHRPILPAVVTKVWDGVVNLQVLPDLDLRVLQDATCQLTFVPFVKYGKEPGTWCRKGEE